MPFAMTQFVVVRVLAPHCRPLSPSSNAVRCNRGCYRAALLKAVQLPTPRQSLLLFPLFRVLIIVANDLQARPKWISWAISLKFASSSIGVINALRGIFAAIDAIGVRD